MTQLLLTTLVVANLNAFRMNVLKKDQRRLGPNLINKVSNQTE